MMTPELHRSPVGKHSEPSYRATCAALLVLALSACQAPVDDPSLDQPLLGRSTETTFVMGTEAGTLRIRDAVAVAKVLRRYRDITAAEQALVRLAVRRHLDAAIAMEVRKLEVQQAAERARIDRLPDAAERQRRQAEHAAKLRAEAARRVAAQFGGLLAVPMKTSDQRSVVSFARVVSDDIRVADAAYEVDTPLDRVGPGTKIAALPTDAGLQPIKGSARAAEVLVGASVSLK